MAKVAHPTTEQVRGDLTWYLLGVKRIHATPTKQDLGTAKRFFSKFLTSTPILFTWESPPTSGAR